MKVRPIQRFPTRKHPSVRGQVNHQAVSFTSYQHHNADHSPISSHDSYNSSEDDADEVYDMTNLSLGDIEDIENTIRILHSKADMDALGWMSPLKKYYKSPRGKGADSTTSAFPFTDEHISTPKKQKSPKRVAAPVASHANSSDESLFTPKSSLPLYHTSASETITDIDRMIHQPKLPKTSLSVQPPMPPASQDAYSEHQANELWGEFEAMFVDDDVDLNKIRNNNTSMQGGNKKQVHFSGQENQPTYTNEADAPLGTKAHLKQFLSSPIANHSEAFFVVNSLPPMILEKLKQAEKQLEVELAKERQRALSKLQQILLIGKQAYLAEVDHELIQQWDQRDRSILLHQLHDEVMTEATTSFGANRGQRGGGAAMKLDSDRSMYIQLLLKQLKARKQNELNDELRLLTTQLAKVTAKQVEEKSKLHVSHHTLLSTADDDHR